MKRQHVGIRVLGLPNNHGSTARESVFVSFALYGIIIPFSKEKGFVVSIKKRRDDFSSSLFCISSKKPVSC
jgi:hypothetical protein